jgi:hypothetical protein
MKHLIRFSSPDDDGRIEHWCGRFEYDPGLGQSTERPSEVTCYGCLRTREQHLRHELRAVLEQQHHVGRP